MAIGKKTGGRDWLPGESGNPNGRKPIPEDIKAIRKLTHDQIADVMETLLTTTEGGLTDLLNDPETPVLKKWIAKVAQKGLTHGDAARLETLLNRTVGKVPDVLKVPGLSAHALLMGILEKTKDDEKV